MTGHLPDQVSVELDSSELGGPVSVGSLRRIPASGGAIAAFAFDRDWLRWPGAFSLDPAFGLFEGDQYPAIGNLAAVFADAAPDRWGRMLLERREAAAARAEGRRRRQLGDWEFLLGVSDVTRMGALRFRAPDGRYLDDSVEGIPPLTRLRALEAAAMELDQPSRAGRLDEAAQLALLLAPGSSLGGARPKASFVAEDGTLWMAKFPSRSDRYDVGACEWVLHQLADRAGIPVPRSQLLRLAGPGRTFAVRRFDRSAGSRRLYASAMTLVGRQDRDDAGYPDIALAIADHGASARLDEDLAALFRRATFNVLVANRDDHLRNHGFLRTLEGWRLAPAFDLNPAPDKPSHELALDGDSSEPDVELLRASSAFYRLRVAEADRIIGEVGSALSSWRDTAQVAGLGPAELDLLEAAIESP